MRRLRPPASGALGPARRGAEAARGPPGTAVPGAAISPSGSAGAAAAVTLDMESGFGSDFGSGGGGGGKLDPGLIMEQVKVQIAVANAQELLQVRRGCGARRGLARSRCGSRGAAGPLRSPRSPS